jgi:putative membrane protein
MAGRLLLLVGAMLAVVGLAGCQQMNMDKGRVETAADYTFLRNVAQINAAETEAGALAVQKAADGQVRAFGERMIRDHSSANAKLMALANEKGVVLPIQPSHADKALIKSLKHKIGAAFDRDYITHMVSGHTEAVKMIEKEIADGKDPAVVAFAREILPVIKEHLDLAKEAAAKIGA